MEFIKSNWAKKLIIVLVALMIFNIAVPNQVQAWDYAGILAKPFYGMVMSVVAAVDVAFGLLIYGIDNPGGLIGYICEKITDDEESVNNLEEIKSLFIGPDTIFCGQVEMVNANIFDVSSEETEDCNCGKITCAKCNREKVATALKSITKYDIDYRSPRKKLNATNVKNCCWNIC